MKMKCWFTLTILLSSVSAAVLRDCIAFKSSSSDNVDSKSNFTISTEEFDTSVLMYNLIDVPKTNIPLLPSQEVIQSEKDGFGICSIKARDGNLCSTPGDFILKINDNNTYSPTFITKGHSITYDVTKDGFYCFIAYQGSHPIKGLQVHEFHSGSISTFDQCRRSTNFYVMLILSLYLFWKLDNHYEEFVTNLYLQNSARVPILISALGMVLMIQMMSFSSQNDIGSERNITVIEVLFMLLRIIGTFHILFIMILFGGDLFNSEKYVTYAFATSLYYIYDAIISGFAIEFHCRYVVFSFLSFTLKYARPFVWFHWMFLLNRTIKHTEIIYFYTNRAFAKRLRASRISVISILVTLKIYSYMSFLFKEYFATRDLYTGLNGFLHATHIEFEVELWEHFHFFDNSIWWKTLLVNLNDISPLLTLFSLYVIWISFATCIKTEPRKELRHARLC